MEDLVRTIVGAYQDFTVLYIINQQENDHIKLSKLIYLA